VRVSDPEETAPFTHQPYGRDGEENPFVSPSGPAAQPSGPSYVQPPVPPPPASSPVPYGPPYGPPQPGVPWQQGWTPAYAAPYPGSQDHKGATTSLVLGIVSIVCLLGTFVCCVTLPGVLCAPFAWFTGAKALREMDRAPGVYGNRSAATTGMWMGIVMTVLGALAIAGTIALFVLIGTTTVYGY
jgi:hypothetical protein